MLIVEHFFLIACDPRAGLPTWPRRTQSAELMAAAALLLDLATLRRLSMRQSLLHADAQVPLTHPLLADALHALDGHPQSAQSALQLVARRLHPLPANVLESLFRRDLVHRTESRRWLLRKQVRYPLRSMQARNEAVLRMRQAIDAENDLHGLALLLLADVTGMLPLHLNAREHEQAMQRLLALNLADTPSDEPRATVVAIRAALLA
ncbi:MAG: GPP34 family phosphoprotein [Rudaea sp.]|nr:GPP34 family phosphoprotein [Rudaea sp.]